MLYLSLFCLNLSCKSLDVYNSGGGVVPNSDVYKYSDPTFGSNGKVIMRCDDRQQARRGNRER